MQDPTEAIKELQKRVKAIELRLQPREKADSNLLQMNQLIVLLVDILPVTAVNAILLKSRHPDGFCDFCYKDEGHTPLCPIAMLLSARKEKELGK